MITFPAVQHPRRYVWDFWYIFDAATRQYHLFYLSAETALVPLGQHHFATRLGHAVTSDFSHIDWGDGHRDHVLIPPSDHWADAALWSGDVIQISNGYLWFFTGRRRHQDDGMTQAIGMAYSPDLTSDRWQVTALGISPGHGYQPKTVAGDTTFHAWRDPFLFRDQGQIYMLVEAKETDAPLGRSGVVGLLRLKDNDVSQSQWDYLDPLVQPRRFSEIEVPQLYQTPQGQYELVFSCWAKHDRETAIAPTGGLQGFSGPHWTTLSPTPYTLLAEGSGLYACRVIPELGGEIVGFDVQRGGIRRSGIKTGWQAVNRDFSDCWFRAA